MTDTDSKLYEIGVKVGETSATLAALTKVFEQHCHDDDRRHQENVTILTSIKDALAPLVANQAMSKKRLALFGTIGVTFLVGLSWAVESGLKWAIGHLLNIKFGG